MTRYALADLIMRAGLAFAFLYPPIDGFIDPYAWIGYLPKFAVAIMPPMPLLIAFEILEIILALWILSGKRIFIPASLMAIILVAIVSLNLPNFQVVFRDLVIAALALSLAVLHAPMRTRVS